MKKNFLLAITALFASSAVAYDFSFEPSTNPWLGVTVGYVSSQLHTTSSSKTTTSGILGEQIVVSDGTTGKQKKDSWTEFTDKAKQWPSRNYSTCIQAGLTFNPEFKYGIGLKTGLLYECAIYNGGDQTEFAYSWQTQSGKKKVTSSYSEKTSSSYVSSDHALSIPLQISWRVEVYKELSLFIYTGPVIDVHLGTYTESYSSGSTYQSSTSSTTHTWSEEAYYKGYNNYSTIMSSKVTYKKDGKTISSKSHGWKEEKVSNPLSTRCNVLWAVGAGIQWKGLRLTIGGQFGMNNMVINKKNGIQSMKIDKPFEISLSYLFLDYKK